jgi:hypothetical protein
VLSGNFNTDLGALIQQDPRIFHAILSFRNSSEGLAFRKAVSSVLAVPSGGEFAAAVNAGLERNVPIAVLQMAKDKLSFLLTNNAKTVVVPAVWGNTGQSDQFTHFWRAKSLRVLLQLCDSSGIGKNDPCICGSGDKLRLCCIPPLRG